MVRSSCDSDEPADVVEPVLSSVFFSSEKDELLLEALAVLRFE
jgi:hypothetical protein